MKNITLEIIERICAFYAIWCNSVVPERERQSANEMLQFGLNELQKELLAVRAQLSGADTADLKRLDDLDAILKKALSAESFDQLLSQIKAGKAQIDILPLDGMQFFLNLAALEMDQRFHYQTDDRNLSPDEFVEQLQNKFAPAIDSDSGSVDKIIATLMEVPNRYVYFMKKSWAQDVNSGDYATEALQLQAELPRFSGFALSEADDTNEKKLAAFNAFLVEHKINPELSTSLLTLLLQQIRGNFIYRIPAALDSSRALAIDNLGYHVVPGDDQGECCRLHCEGDIQKTVIQPPKKGALTGEVSKEIVGTVSIAIVIRRDSYYVETMQLQSDDEELRSTAMAGDIALQMRSKILERDKEQAKQEQRARDIAAAQVLICSPRLSFTGTQPVIIKNGSTAVVAENDLSLTSQPATAIKANAS